MAIILDGNVYSDPLSENWWWFSFYLTGAGGYEDLLGQSRDLALVLRAGALPVERVSRTNCWSVSGC